MWFRPNSPKHDAALRAANEGSLLTTALGIAQNEAKHWRELAIRQEARLNELTDRLSTMQRDGYRPRDVAPQPVEEPELPDEIIEAIIERGGGLATDRGRQLSAWAVAELSAKRKPDQIVKELWNGVTS